MALDEFDKIDMVLGPTKHAKVTLVALDGRPHKDQELRFRRFAEKLQAYVSYVLSPQFWAERPGVKPSQVLICVACHEPPSDLMTQVTSVRPTGDADPSHLIKVVCVEWRRGMPLPHYFTPLDK